MAGEKPEVVKTHLRNMVILPEMVGSQIGVYNGKVFTQVTFRWGNIRQVIEIFSNKHIIPNKGY